MIILIKPIITEKSTRLASLGEYIFLVDNKANKKQIAHSVKNKFGVDIVQVKIINIKPKKKMQKRARKSYEIPGFKKAIVKVKNGQKIAIFETPKDEALVTTPEGEPQVIKERKDIFRRTNVRVERGATGAAPTTQRKVIPT